MIQQFITKLNDKEKKMFYFAAGAVILALFDLLFLGPVTSRLKTINEEILEKENNLKRDVRLLSYKDRILTERETFSPYYNSEVMTPDQIKASFLQKIEMLATEAKVNLTKVAPSGEEKQKSFVKYMADLECTGSLEDIVKFMHLIDSTQELLKIVKVNVISKQSAKDVSVTMTVVRIIFDPRAVWTEKELNSRAKRQNSAQGAGGSGGGGTGQGGVGEAGAEGGASGTGGSGPGAGGQPGQAQGPALKAGSAQTSDDISIGPAGTEKNIPAGQIPPEGLVDETASQAPKADGRVKVTNIMDLWHNFWGMEEPEPKPGDVSTENINWDEVQEDQNKPNLWEKLQGKGK